MAVRTLLAALCLALPVAAQALHTESQIQREWALGAGALLAQMDGEGLALLGGTEDIATVAAARRQQLLESWEIRSRADLIEVAQGLIRDDSDRMRIGWNYVRLINLVRWGFA